MAQYNRLRELDFLRGVAIILVLIRHSSINHFLVNIGWIGVDLFFVLSGFLVSGLLFKEYKRFGKLNVKRFLIRRGFKIYPLFYITALPYILLKILDGNFSFTQLLGDLTFLQNYVSNWGYLYSAGWSLAVEEHFYLGIAAILYLGQKTSLFKNATLEKDVWFDNVVRIILLILTSVLCFRLMSNYYLFNNAKLFSLTHLRIDSLLAGVLLSYFYYFKFEKLKEYYLNFHKPLLILSFLCLLWTPFINPVPSFFVKTIGFSLLYLSFSILLLSFVLDKRVNQKLDSIFTNFGANFISKIGFSSYSIYTIHTLINILILKIQVKYELFYNPYLYFLLTSSISIFSGLILTNYVEKYFLNLRNKYYPSRVKTITSANKN